MKILIDEQTPVIYAKALRLLLDPRHKIDHVDTLQWKSKKDVALLADARQRGYDVFITNDRAQLRDPAETKAIRKSGMHHICYTRRGKGLAAQATALAAIIAALPVIADEVETSTEQLLIKIKGFKSDRNARIEVTRLSQATYSR